MKTFCSPKRLPLAHGFLVMAACSLVVACTEVRVPASDGTPPTVKLAVLAEDTMVTSNGTEATYRAREHERLTLIAVGSDSSGVRRVWIEGTVGFGCTIRSEGVIRHADGRYDDDSAGMTVDAGPGDLVKMELADALNWSWSDQKQRACPFGEDFALSGSYTGHAENFHGGIAETAVLRIEVP